jgi:hypothetical protein
VGVIALTTPQGFLVGLLVGTVVYYGFQRFGRSGPEEEAHPELVR